MFENPHSNMNIDWRTEIISPVSVQNLIMDGGNHPQQFISFVNTIFKFSNAISVYLFFCAIG